MAFQVPSERSKTGMQVPYYHFGYEARPVLYFSLVSGFLFFVSGAHLFSAIGVSFSVYCFARAFLFPDRPIPIRWLILGIASLQWILAPAIAYRMGLTNGRMEMYVPEGEYMVFAVPGILAFAIGLLSIGDRLERECQNRSMLAIPYYLKRNSKIPQVLLGVSIFGTVLSTFAPGSLAFVAFLLSNLKFSAAFLFLFSQRPGRFYWILGIFFFAAAESLTTARFHDAILWATFLALGHLYANRASIKMRSMIAALGIVILMVVNSSKPDYRELIWGRGEDASVITYALVVEETLSSILAGRESLEGSFENFVIRLNQGWIISRIIWNTERTNNFLKGDTVLSGLEAALLPRFLSPNKAGAGGVETFEMMTGLRLSQGTSMGASILGEAYGNFGGFGGVLFMCTFGVGMSFFLTVIFRWFSRDPLIICFLPAMFLHTIKAETDFTTSLNFLVKASILYVFVWLIVRTFYKSRRADY